MSDRTERSGLSTDGETTPQSPPPIPTSDSTSTRDSRSNPVPSEPVPIPPYNGPMLLDIPIVQLVGDASHLAKLQSAVDLIRSYAGALTSYQISVIQLLTRLEIGLVGPSVNVFTGVFHLTLNFITKASIAYIASAIAHDAYHCELARTGQYWMGAAAEYACRQFQISIGKVIGLSAWEISELEKIPADETHG